MSYYSQSNILANNSAINASEQIAIPKTKSKNRFSNMVFNRGLRPYPSVI
jgi:hypothetical protein